MHHYDILIPGALKSMQVKPATAIGRANRVTIAVGRADRRRRRPALRSRRFVLLHVRVISVSHQILR